MNALKELTNATRMPSAITSLVVTSASAIQGTGEMGETVKVQ